jgi:hypothetical protein
MSETSAVLKLALLVGVDTRRIYGTYRECREHQLDALPLPEVLASGSSRSS